MCFDIRIEVCGPNEALVISGLCYVSISTNIYTYIYLYIQI